MRSLRFAVALDGLLHLFMNLPQRYSARALQLIGIRSRIEIRIVCHGSRFFLMLRLDLDTDARLQQACGRGVVQST